jgi:hypothetical protein
MHGNEHQLIESLATRAGWFYLIASAMNVGAAGHVWRKGRKPAWAITWLVVAGAFAALGSLALAGSPWVVMPEPLKAALDAGLGPATFSLGCFVTLLVLYLGRKWFVIPAVAWAVLNLSLLFLGLSLTDREFAAVVGQPDNVPIVAMVYLLAFFTWLATAQAVENDRRVRQQSVPVEKEHAEKVLVWPDLVYTELICMILVTVVLVVWSLVLKAPLEQPANPVVTPNPSKAPWYFLGLQELLTYSDAWNVGIVVPCLIVLGLIAVPYLDVNREGNGYYTIRQRRFAYLVFQFGFLQLWILLILIGTFMRGPNWSFFGPYEVRDPYEVVDLENEKVDQNKKLSEHFWKTMIGRQHVPEVPLDGGFLVRLRHVLWREIAGVVLMGAYFLALPLLMGRTILRGFRRQMGLARYTLMVLLLLMMATLPLKMFLRWTFNLSYVVSMPEYLFNF